MRAISHKCASTISLLALATLPSDRALRERTPTHDDFKTASGYIKREIGGEVVHAIDWDGKPGVESIFRENGQRSRRAWLEFREWHHTHPAESLRAAGTKACEVLVKHFGPYDRHTSDALETKRALKREREELLRNLDREFPTAVRLAARLYVTPQMFPALQSSHFPTILPISALSLETGLLSSVPYDPQGDTNSAHTLAQAEETLRRHLELCTGVENRMNVDDFARMVVERIKPVEARLDMLDLTDALTRLPAIPGEEEPADMDRVEPNHLICRHRAVIVAILLADCGFRVELVRGTVEQEGRQGGHLFIYAAEEGVLEASAHGPDFWKTVHAAQQEQGILSLKIKEGATYRCEHRTQL